jgi:putative transposase
MNTELTHFLGRGPYERRDGQINHRNGSYQRKVTLKIIQYEDERRQELSMMFFTGVSTRSLSMIFKRLIGRKISHACIG